MNINTQELINFLINQQEVKTISLNNLINIFFNKLKLNNRAGTINGYKSALRPILKYLKSKKIINVNQINTNIINEYVNLRYGKVKNVTINKEVKSLKTMVKYAFDNDYIDKIPFKYKNLKETKPDIKSIEIKDINKIINYFKTCKKDKKYILAFMLILTTGIRTTELINIKNKNIDLKNMIIKLDFTKNGKQRNIFIVSELKDLISEVKNENEYLFLDEEQNQMTANNLRCFFKHLKKDLEIQVLSPHKLRHYYATTIYKNSLDIYLTCNLLGHSDIKMTQIYLDIDNKDNQLKNQMYNPINELDLLTC